MTYQGQEGRRHSSPQSPRGNTEAHSGVDDRCRVDLRGVDVGRGERHGDAELGDRCNRHHGGFMPCEEGRKGREQV